MAIPSSQFASNSLTIYKFDGASNNWVLWPGVSQFNTEAGRGYYVYSQTSKTVSLPFVPLPTTNQTLTKGWNLLYNIGDKTLDTARMTYGGQVNKTVQELINSSTIDSRVYVIDNTQATEACNYFKILGRTETSANCAANTLGSTATLQSGKVFWVYVNSQPSPQPGSTEGCFVDSEGRTVCA